MDKRALLKIFAEKIAADLNVATQAALAAHEGATHSESKAEDQYDTRGLEASYLAGAQSKRAMELEETLNYFRFTDLKTFTESTPIAATALVELDCDGKRSFYLFMPRGGGMSARWENRQVQVVTPQSPIGEALLGRRVGDQIEVEIGGTTRDDDIVAIW